MITDNVNNLTISRTKLLEYLNSYRVTHQKEYRSVLEEYRKTVIVLLKDYSEKYGNGKLVKLSFPSKPKTHVSDYDIIIDLINASDEDNFILSENQYRQYCGNEWDWTIGFDATKNLYGVN